MKLSLFSTAFLAATVTADFQALTFTPEMAQKGAAAGASPFDKAAANAFAVGSCPKRIEFRRLAASDRSAFVAAVKCLVQRPSAGGYPGSHNRYEDLVSVHQRMTPQVHMTPIFLPWHRYYLAVFESMLRDECGYRGPMTWWDETLDAGRFTTSLVFQDATFSPAAKKVNGQGTCVSRGVFGGMMLHIGPGSGYSVRCLSRAVDESLTAQCNQNFVNYCNAMTTYANMRPCTEMGPHAYGHNGIGSIMSDVASSPSDPVFFMHHGFIDRNWYRWQNANPGARMYQIDNTNLNNAMTTLGLRPNVRVGDMMDTRGGYLCYEYDY